MGRDGAAWSGRCLQRAEEAFRKAQQDVHALSVPPGRIMQLRLYALFMQATSGNASGLEVGEPGSRDAQKSSP